MSKIAEVLQRLAVLEAEVAEIGHNGGPPLDDEPAPAKRKAGMIPDREVAKRYVVHVRTLERWDKDRALEFPKPTYIRGRRYRDIEELDGWDRASARNRANARKVANPHNPHLDVAQAPPRTQRGHFAKQEEAQAPPKRERFTKQEESAPPKADHLDAATRKRRGSEEERAPPGESGRRKPVKPRFEPSEA
jgi:hypothetical protein